MNIETSADNGVHIVKLTGRFCMGPGLDDFNATVGDLLRQSHNKIVLDLEEVPTIDSSGIGVLVRYLTTAKKSGGAIRLLKPSKFTVQTLKMVGVLNLFSTYDDLPEALASFQ
ncbi:MAG TPA: STAS domain-containing protein [Candidatus Solibacter sp.]|nr:STAS domain-containing protein [Candidatus Solibacter sp.]